MSCVAKYISTLCSRIRSATQFFTMFRAIGVVIVLWYLTSLFSNTLHALDRAAVATLGAVEESANVSKEHITK